MLVAWARALLAALKAARWVREYIRAFDVYDTIESLISSLGSLWLGRSWIAHIAPIIECISNRD
jgi:hypothetical protein